jgi:hypothetical protein
MQAESKFLKQPQEFWANVKLISQKVGYTNRGIGTIKVPSIEDIESAYDKLGLDSSKIIFNNKVTAFGSLLIEYFQFRANFLTNHIEPNLQNLAEAKALYTKLKANLKPTCPEPLNKQKGEKQGPAYFTSTINMLIEANSKGYDCNYDPKELSAFTHNNFPIRSLSRRVDGARIQSPERSHQGASRARGIGPSVGRQNIAEAREPRHNGTQDKRRHRSGRVRNPEHAGGPDAPGADRGQRPSGSIISRLRLDPSVARQDGGRGSAG